MRRRPGWDAQEAWLGCTGGPVGMHRRPGWDAQEARLGCTGGPVGMLWSLLCEEQIVKAGQSDLKELALTID